ncbi:MAG TPA: hypothetical protein P5064_08095 [Clostridia bacterium]|jgi:fermentation-respiration switch protein FrsA (DUF1100 family)|nr:hypothetical protein [Clostridia bacterium]
MKDFYGRKATLVKLAICVALIVISALVGSFVQTAGWTAKIEDLRNKTNTGTITIKATDSEEAKDYTVNGKVVSGILITPKNATKDHPAPGVVFTHGLFNNREMQLQNGIEAARRGYVVLLIDRESHGHNDTTTYDNYGDSMLSAAKYLYNLTDPQGNRIVDGSRILVSGHSMGGSATNGALMLDGVSNKTAITVGDTKYTWEGQVDEALSKGYHMGIISAGIVQANNAQNASYGTNLKGVSVLKASSDEFFFASTTKNGIYRPLNLNQNTELLFTQGINEKVTTNRSLDGKLYVKKGDDYVAITSSDTYHKKTQYYVFTKNGNSPFYLMSSQAMNFVGKPLESATGEQYEVINGGIYDFNKEGALIGQPKDNKYLSAQTGGAQQASDTVQIRAVYEAKENHPMNHFSRMSAAGIIDFCYNVFGVAEGTTFKAPNNQTWWIKEVFAIFGIAGLFGLLVILVDLLLKTKAFASLAAAEGDIPEAPVLLTKPRKHVFYWLSGILTAWYGYYAWENIVRGKNWYANSFWRTLITDTTSEITGQTYTSWANAGTIAYWGICCATFALIITAVIWLINRVINMIVYKDDYLAHEERPFLGFRIRSVGNIFKTLALAAILCFVFFGTIQLLWNVLVVDFRAWTFAFRIFKTDRLLSYLRYVPFFFVFYMTNAALNINYRVKDLPEWATVLINVVFNVGWLIISVWYFNSYFINVGAFTNSTLSMQNIWTYPIIPCVATATIVSRRLYVRTGNAWLAGLVNATIMALVCCAGTSIGA